MSTIQADVLQLSRLVDGMLLKWCLQSGSFLLGEVEEGRNGWEPCQGAALSLWCVGALPNGWLPLWSLPTPLSTRQLGKLRAGCWKVYAKSLEQGYALADNEDWRLCAGLSGSLSPQLRSQRGFPDDQDQWPPAMQPSSLVWSLLLPTEFLIVHLIWPFQARTFSHWCVCVCIYIKEFH